MVPMGIMNMIRIRGADTLILIARPIDVLKNLTMTIVEARNGKNSKWEEPAMVLLFLYFLT
jgi:hypothetical protein